MHFDCVLRGGAKSQGLRADAGEEVVTKESFISICWRLIPYWLNKWEQEWGAECSSMMFELPHFAVELLVVLPCVQVRPVPLSVRVHGGEVPLSLSLSVCVGVCVCVSVFGLSGL